METFIPFLNALSYTGVAIGVFMIAMYLYAEYSLNHTEQGKARQLLAQLENKTIYIRPVGKYVVILAISGSWLISQWWT